MGPYVPKDLQEYIQNLEKDAFFQITKENYELALKTYGFIFDLLNERQLERGIRIHLGAPLHMMGFCWLFLENIEESFKHFLMAYITDVINAPINNLDSADGSPASNVLINIFNINSRVVYDVKELSRSYDKDKAFLVNDFYVLLISKIGSTVNEENTFYNKTPTRNDIINIRNNLIKEIYVSENGQKIINKASEDYRKRIVVKASQIAFDDNRKIITKKDVDKAIKLLNDEKRSYVY